MRYLKTFMAGAAGLALSTAALCSTIELAGVKVEDTATVADTKLQLNGAGIRYKGPFKVYVGELFTTKKVSNLDELIAAPGPKRLTLTFLRDVEASTFGKLMTRGVEDNVPKAEMSKLIPGLIRMGDIFTVNKTFFAGDRVVLDWIPGTGLVVYGKGKVQGEPFKEPEFFKALMASWFGPSPGDWRFKDAMLGIKPQN
jgi:hypothetical protein